MRKIKWWIKMWLENRGYYKIDDLVIGGHCGLCGDWIPDEIFPFTWSWGVCKKHYSPIDK